jgi:hypothetical protein
LTFAIADGNKDIKERTEKIKEQKRNKENNMNFQIFFDGPNPLIVEQKK